jgi:hypothetical protein
MLMQKSGFESGILEVKGLVFETALKNGDNVF